MALANEPERVAVSSGADALTYAEVDRQARAVCRGLVDTGARAVLHIGPSSTALPVALFAAARAGVPFVPLNYRLSAAQLDTLVADHPEALLVHDGAVPAAASGPTVHRNDLGSWG